LPRADRAEAVIRRMMSGDFFSGWGLRTLSTEQPRYNPMSYHNGSVWPHDTSVAALGFSYYGERDSVVKVTAALFEAATQFEMRLPELFCGFPRAAGEPPVAYPVACLPQAWAAGSVFMLLQACLGLSINGWTGRVTVSDPHLPDGVDAIALCNLPVACRQLDLSGVGAGCGVGR